MKEITKEERLSIVNQIIAEIAARGRKFLSYEGVPYYMHIKGNKIFVRETYKGRDCCFSVPAYMRIKNWHDGGTMTALVKDFKEYVQNGGNTNHNNGYGGLYCPHWGYPQEDMQAIQAKAIELGYMLPAYGIQDLFEAGIAVRKEGGKG